MVFVGKQGQRDAPVVDLGQARQKKYSRDVKAESEQQQRLQLVDQARQLAIQIGGAAEAGVGCDGVHAGPLRVDRGGARNATTV